LIENEFPLYDRIWPQVKDFVRRLFGIDNPFRYGKIIEKSFRFVRISFPLQVRSRSGLEAAERSNRGEHKDQPEEAVAERWKEAFSGGTRSGDL
jgi:hypothetical protein